MKKVLYITNIEVPYRVRFFNELSKFCDLTVLYEREKSSNRDSKWVRSETGSYRAEYLSGDYIGDEYGFSFKILKYILGKYDAIIIGCYNSPVQMMAICIMKMLHIAYYLNLDGEVFIKKNGLKTLIKGFFLRGAKKYLVAGEKVSESLHAVVGDKDCIPYYFSSLTIEEIKNNIESTRTTLRGNTILVVGQYFDYKGMDVALKVSSMDQSLHYRFIGMGKRTDLFLQLVREKGITNVEVVPFLQKKELEIEYRTCNMLVLPSRQECWGLVANEAASFGTPIISTWGSGAAVEFLADEYPQFLAESGNAKDLYNKICAFTTFPTKQEYIDFLMRKSQNYSIQHAVEVHCNSMGINL